MLPLLILFWSDIKQALANGCLSLPPKHESERLLSRRIHFH